MKVVILGRYLEMTDPAQARLAFPEIPGMELVRAVEKDGSMIQEIYQEVGRDHLWVARAGWTAERFGQRAVEPGVRIWLAKVNGTPAAFVEMARLQDGTEHIFFLGVRSRFAGQGLGKYLLSYAVREAWKDQPRAVWLETTIYDGEHALDNYLKRGFRVSKVRPRAVKVPREMEEIARHSIERAKQRGLYPNRMKRIEGHLRVSLPGRAAALLLYHLRGGAPKTQRQSAR